MPTTCSDEKWIPQKIGCPGGFHNTCLRFLSFFRPILKIFLVVKELEGADSSFGTSEMCVFCFLTKKKKSHSRNVCPLGPGTHRYLAASALAAFTAPSDPGQESSLVHHGLRTWLLDLSCHMLKSCLLQCGSTTTHQKRQQKKTTQLFSNFRSPTGVPFVESTPLLAPSAPLKDKISLAFPRSTAHLSLHEDQVVSGKEDSIPPIRCGVYPP